MQKIHRLIDSKKDPIADVSSVYFVEPTFDNIDLIINVKKTKNFLKK